MIYAVVSPLHLPLTDLLEICRLLPSSLSRAVWLLGNCATSLFTWTAPFWHYSMQWQSVPLKDYLTVDLSHACCWPWLLASFLLFDPQLYVEYCCLLRRMPVARNLVNLLLVSFAFCTILSRIDDNKHHWSDVLSGAIIGAGVAITLVSDDITWTSQWHHTVHVDYVVSKWQCSDNMTLTGLYKVLGTTSDCTLIVISSGYKYTLSNKQPRKKDINWIVLKSVSPSYSGNVSLCCVDDIRWCLDGITHHCVYVCVRAGVRACRCSFWYSSGWIFQRGIALTTQMRTARCLTPCTQVDLRAKIPASTRRPWPWPTRATMTWGLIIIRLPGVRRDYHRA